MCHSWRWSSAYVVVFGPGRQHIQTYSSPATPSLRVKCYRTSVFLSQGELHVVDALVAKIFGRVKRVAFSKSSMSLFPHIRAVEFFYLDVVVANLGIILIKSKNDILYCFAHCLVLLSFNNST